MLKMKTIKHFENEFWCTSGKKMMYFNRVLFFKVWHRNWHKSNGDSKEIFSNNNQTNVWHKHKLIVIAIFDSLFFLELFPPKEVRMAHIINNLSNCIYTLKYPTYCSLFVVSKKARGKKLSDI